MGVHNRQNSRPSHTTAAGSPDPTDTTFTSIIPNPGTVTSVTGIISASQPPLTTITQTVTGIDTSGHQTTAVQTNTIYDSSVYASLIATETSTVPSTSTHAASSSSDASSAKSTGSSSHKSSHSNTSTLIPAIVVPLAVLLTASFALFWFFMRRRHRRELKAANFVMAGKGEKLRSTSPSTRSNPSSRVGTSSGKDLPAVTTTELSRKEKPLSPPRSYPAGEIGIARALTPQDQHRPPRTDSAAGSISSQQRSPHIAQAAGSAAAIRNFNSPRPGTAGQQRPPNPSINSQPQNRNRSRSQPGNRGPPPQAGSGYPPYKSPPLNTYVRGSPNSPQGTGQSRTYGLPRSPSNGPRPNPRTAGSLSPSHIGTGPATRASPPPPITAPPVGSFNGAGPISQYSPIVKETPGKKGLGLRTSGLDEDSRTRELESGNSSASGLGLGLTEENMRIARLGAGISAKTPSPVTANRPRDREEAHRRDVSHNETEQTEDDFDDARSAVSSLHEMERFDFDNWDGDGAHTRRVSRDEGGRVSPIQRERDSFSLDIR